MKILMANKYYFIRGGSERYFFELKSILESHGHSVIPFAMKHPDNFATPYEKYFVDQIEFDRESAWQTLRDMPRIAARVIYSMQARERLERLIRLVSPDIAHLHMIEHQISPSILHSLKKYGIPVVMTAHQSKIICPNYRLFNWNTMKICEKCLDGKYYHPILEKCHKNSRLAGLLICIEAYVHKWLKLYSGNIDLLLVPSRFLGQKLKEAGFRGPDIEHQFSTIQMDTYTPSYGSDDYYLYFGRLEGAKGLGTLLAAAARLPEAKLCIIGEGPERKSLEQWILEHRLNHISILGARYGDALKRLISRSRFVVVPSECYENSPLVVYESSAMGKPVIGSRIGGIPELIDHEKTGLLFEAGDADGLTEKISRLWYHPDVACRYGKQARKKAEHEFSPSVHYERMIARYERLVNARTKTA
jgi:glycosyltransferase involved in cell wall biosynthesis